MISQKTNNPAETEKMQCGHTAAVFICNCYEGNKTFRNKDVWSSSCDWLYVHKHMPCSGNENMALRVMTDSLRVPISQIQTTIVLTSCCGSHILHFINNREETKNNRTLKTRACGWKIFSYKTLTKHWSALTKVIYTIVKNKQTNRWHKNIKRNKKK